MTAQAFFESHRDAGKMPGESAHAVDGAAVFVETLFSRCRGRATRRSTTARCCSTSRSCLRRRCGCSSARSTASLPGCPISTPSCSCASPSG